MRTSLTELRADLYNKIDHLIDTGESIEIERKGHLIKVISIKPYSKLKRLIRRNNVITDPSDELIGNKWLNEWRADNDLS